MQPHISPPEQSGRRHFAKQPWAGPSLARPARPFAHRDCVPAALAALAARAALAATAAAATAAAAGPSLARIARPSAHRDYFLTAHAAARAATAAAATAAAAAVGAIGSAFAERRASARRQVALRGRRCAGEHSVGSWPQRGRACPSPGGSRMAAAATRAERERGAAFASDGQPWIVRWPPRGRGHESRLPSCGPLLQLACETLGGFSSCPPSRTLPGPARQRGHAGGLGRGWMTWSGPTERLHRRRWRRASREGAAEGASGVRQATRASSPA